VNSNATVSGRSAKAIDGKGQKPALPADPGNCAVSLWTDEADCRILMKPEPSAWLCCAY
jgi:hypothetical protein